MKKPVAPYSEQCVTIFCDNCGRPVKFGVTREAAKQRKADQLEHCPECKPTVEAYRYHVGLANEAADKLAEIRSEQHNALKFKGGVN